MPKFRALRPALGLLLALSSFLLAATAQASNQFLWKPVSESNGCLVVLFPNQYRLETVESITVVGAGGTARPTRTSQDGANGDRIHARFPAPGAKYGKDVKVVLTFTGGGTRTWIVPDGSRRFEKNGGGTGAAAPAGGAPGASTSEGFTNLDDVLGAGANAGDVLVRLTSQEPGKRQVTLASDGTLSASVLLRTYGPASLALTVNGKPWIAWSRADDADGSACQVGGQTKSESIYEENPGDPSARDVTASLEGKKGDVVAASLEGSFGGAEAYVLLRGPASGAPATEGR